MSKFTFDITSMTISTPQHRVPTVNVDGKVWFRGNDCAWVLGYVNAKDTIRYHVLPRWKLSLGEILVQGGAGAHPPGKYNKNDLKATWISQPGLLKLCASSGIIGEEFSIWIFEEVIPSIMATGQYSINKSAGEPVAQPADSDLWNQKRLDGIELFKLKNESVKKLLACCVGGGQWASMYKIIHGAINRAILDYNCSKKVYLMDNRLPQTASIPDLLAFDGQLLRSMMERRYHAHIMENWGELQKMTEREMECCFNAIGKQMQDANRAGGYTVPREKLLSLDEVKSKKKGLAIARKRGLLPSADVKVLSLAGPQKKQRTLMSFV